MSFLSGTSSFVAAWARTRPTHVLHRALLVLFVVSIIAIPAIIDTPTNVLLARYSKAGFGALRKDNTEAAELYFRRMGRLDASNADGRYGMGLTAAKKENTPLATRLMSELAHAEPKHLLAHSWLAGEIISGKSGKLTDDDFWALRRHLEMASTEATENVKSRAILGTMLLARGAFHEAIPHLEAVVGSRPELRTALSRAYASVQRDQEARAQITLALNHFREQNLASPGDPNTCLLRVQCELMAGNTSIAERVLRLACQRFSGDPRFLVVLQELHLTGCDESLKAGHHDIALKHLDQALALNPEAAGLMERFAFIASGDNESNEMALRLLRQVAAKGSAPAAAHLAIGGVMLRRENLREAATHFEIGLRHDPNSVALLNNLAWCLCKDDKGNHDRALQLIDNALRRAVRSDHQRATVRETRGQILAKLGRDREAAVELEKALPLLSRPQEAHRTLQKLYARLGQHDLAEVHNKLKPRPRLAEDPRPESSRQ